MDNNKQKDNPPKVDKEKLVVAKQAKKKALVTNQIVTKKECASVSAQVVTKDCEPDKNKLK
jgi:hypothetical protein